MIFFTETDVRDSRTRQNITAIAPATELIIDSTLRGGIVMNSSNAMESESYLTGVLGHSRTRALPSLAILEYFSVASIRSAACVWRSRGMVH